jgi:hypothetical protein
MELRNGEVRVCSSLTIRHFTEGRMKNQAFIECPSQEIAAAVLEGIHGLVVHGKPLVVVRVGSLALLTVALGSHLVSLCHYSCSANRLQELQHQQRCSHIDGTILIG